MTMRNYRQPARRGITIVITMLFLVLIGTLSLGFYASTTTSMQLAKNDQKGARALLAAESGVQFMRYHLSHVTVTSANDPNQMMTDLYNDLQTALGSSGNLGTNTIGFTQQNGVTTITIPQQQGKCIVIDPSDNTGFAVTITNVGGGAASVVCKVLGYTGNGSYARDKGVQLTFTRAQNPSTIFDSAVAAKGKIGMSKGSLGGIPGISPDTIASIMSARDSSPSFVMSGGSIGGGVGVLDLSYASITGGTVHGTSSVTSMITNGYLGETTAPEFPTFDTTVFAQYATNTYTSGNILSNVTIPANTNPDFSGNVTVSGIVYVKSPNTVRFRGNTTLAGFIVFENAGTSATNIIDMRGNFSVANLPAGAQYDALRTITGIAVLAPTASMTMTGSADSNFRGNVIVDKFTNGGSADLQFDSGSIVAMSSAADAVNFNGKAIKWKSTGMLNQPSAGVTYSSHFDASSGSYLELN